MGATSTPALDPRYVAKAADYTARADAMQRDQAQLRREGHRDRANRLQISIDALRAAAQTMSEKARGAEMNTSRVVHVSDKIDGALYIGRSMPRQKLKASPLANPYKIGKDGDRANVLRMYALYLHSEVVRGAPETLTALHEAKTRPLACWCRKDGEPITDDNRCHGDTILAYLATHTIPEPQNQSVAPRSDENDADHVHGQEDGTAANGEAA